MGSSPVPPALIPFLKDIDSQAQFTYRPPIVSSSSGTNYYAKLGRPSEKEQYTGEAESLKAIEAAAPGLAPKVLASGFSELDGLPYFISEYKHLGSLTSSGALKLAERLAKELHAHTSAEGYGFHVPTFCGPTRLSNGFYETWEECYDAMIRDLLQGLRHRSSNTTLCEKGEQIRAKVIPYLLGSIQIRPALLHGDLWSGNVGLDSKTGEPVMYDPSSFFGHNEADLAIARIFGGFPDSFFSMYHNILPKTEPVDQYELRVDLYELFHYLNHVLIFGSAGYASSSMQKMDRLLRNCPE